jgi:hypothetical protein
MKHISVLLAVCFTISLLWCNDTVCGNITGSYECGTVLCGAHGDQQNFPSTSTNGHCQECTCTCHAPTVVNNMASLCFTPSVEVMVDLGTSRTILVPGKTIFRPPLAV